MLQLSDYTVDISIYDDHVPQARALLPGDLISLVNVHCYTQLGYTVPEIILHGGSTFGRSLRKLTSDTSAGAALLKQLELIPVPSTDPAPALALPEDAPRSLQMSPTECFYPEQKIFSLYDILEHPLNKTLFKIRVLLHSHTPDSYAKMVKHACKNCKNLANRLPDKCFKCGETEFRKALSLTLSVQDASVTVPAQVICVDDIARNFLGVDRVNTSADCTALGGVMGRWCDLHVICKVTPGGSTKLILSHTVIKPTEEVAGSAQPTPLQPTPLQPTPLQPTPLQPTEPSTSAIPGPSTAV